MVVLGPLTMLACALDRDPELTNLLHRLVIMGGAWHEPGNASAVAEFHFFCDPPAARKVLHSGAPITLIPLDVSRKILFSPSDLLELPAPESPTCRFLRQIVPFGIRATSNLYGIEGFHLKDVPGHRSRGYAACAHHQADVGRCRGSRRADPRHERGRCPAAGTRQGERGDGSRRRSRGGSGLHRPDLALDGMIPAQNPSTRPCLFPRLGLRLPSAEARCRPGNGDGARKADPMD